MSTPSMLDAAGRRRSPATLPGYLCGRAPKNKGMRFPADPPRVEEIIAVMRVAGDSAHGLRVRALVAVLWRAGLRISEALALTESDVDPGRGSVLVRHGKGEKRRGERQPLAGQRRCFSSSGPGASARVPVRSESRCKAGPTPDASRPEQPRAWPTARRPLDPEKQARLQIASVASASKSN